MSDNAFQGTARTISGDRIPQSPNENAIEEAFIPDGEYNQTLEINSINEIPPELIGRFWTVENERPVERNCFQRFMIANFACCVGGCCSPGHRRDWVRLLTTFSFWVSVIQLVMYFISIGMTPPKELGFSLTPSIQVQRKLGANCREMVRSSNIYVLLTYIFLHGSIWHIAINLFVQLTCLLPFEPTWGLIRYLIIYFISGILGGLFSVSRNNAAISVGASAAIFGEMGAACALWGIFWTRLAGNIRTMGYVLLFGVALAFLATALIPSVDVLGHLGGLLGGIFIGMLIFCTKGSTTKTQKILFTVGLVGLIILFGIPIIMLLTIK